ncbi:MAG: hypothetical protein FWE53_02345 [Firmicutes bacterium]|nr:hypothetical protein [Bacillota bacterium]
MSSFAKALRKIINDNNIKQVALAKAIGKTVNAVNSWVTETEDLETRPQWHDEVQNLMKFLYANAKDFYPCELFGIDRNEYENAVLENAMNNAKAFIEQEKTNLAKRDKALIYEEIKRGKQQLEKEYKQKLAEHKKLIEQELKEKYHVEMLEFLKTNEVKNDKLFYRYIDLVKDPEFMQLLINIKEGAKFPSGLSWYYKLTKLSEEESLRLAKIINRYLRAS